MASTAPRLPASLDPLVAEAKRRARIRRLLLAAAAIAVAGAVGATFALRGSEKSRLAVVAAPTCRDAQLHLVSAGGGVAGGTAGALFSAVNVSHASCALRGWPALQLVLTGGRRITPPVRRDHLDANAPDGVAPVRRVELGPGDAATFGILDADSPRPGISCRPAKTLLVTPTPGGSSVSVPLGIGQYCGPRLIEVPFVAGRVNHED
jgi:hypothetical protein